MHLNLQRKDNLVHTNLVVIKVYLIKFNDVTNCVSITLLDVTNPEKYPIKLKNKTYNFA